MVFLRKLFPIRKPFHHLLKMSRNVSINVTPSDPSHVSKLLKICGNGFAPHCKLTIQGQLHCPEEVFDFQSYAHIVTELNGDFDLTTAESVGGSYTGIDGMGLFWSMVKTGAGVDRMHINNGKVKLKYHFNVYESHIDRFDDNIPAVCSISVERFLVSDLVIREDVKVGRVRGTLFIPEGEGPFPAIIVLHGGVKKKKPIEQDAALFANQGYVTLALPFYGVDDLPKLYTDGPIDVEYFEEAIDWLCSLDCVISTEIGVIGHSKGGDVSLAIAEHLKQVKSVCWVNGCIGSVLTTTRYRSKVTPMLSFDMGRATFADDGSIFIKDFNANLEDEVDSIHTFEESSASLLFIVSLDDESWDVVTYTDIAKERMDAAGKTNYNILKYDGLGHCLDLPYAPVCIHSSHPLFPRGTRIFYGGTNTALHSKQQLIFWHDIFEFFQMTLKKTPSYTL